MNLHSVLCKTESDEKSDSDEPYVLVTAVQFAPVPGVRTFLYGPWEMDDGDIVTIVTEPPCWGLDSEPTNVVPVPVAAVPPVPAISDLCFLVTVMENDAGEPAGYRQFVQASASAAMAAAALAPDRAARVARILTDVRSALNGHPANNIPLVPSDDHVGTDELVLDPSDAIAAGMRDKSMIIDGGNEGSYQLTFRITRHQAVRFPAGGHLAAVSRPPKHLEVWGVDSSGTMRGNWLDGRWHGWYQLAGAGFDPVVEPAAVARHDNHMEVWAVGTDGGVRGNWFEGGWHDWYALNDLVGGDPAVFPPDATLAAVSRHGNHMEVFGVDVDGTLRCAWFDDGRWDGWAYLAMPGGERLRPGSPITALSRNAKHMEVWVVDDAEQVRGIHFLEGSWRSWLTFAGARFPRGGRLASVSRHPDHMELFAVDVDGVLRGNRFEGSWQPAFAWYPFEGRWTPGADVATASRHTDRMEVWAVGLDGVVRGNWFDGGVWHTWYPLDSARFDLGADLTAVSRSHIPGGLGAFGGLFGQGGPEAMEVWAVDPRGTVRGNWFDGQWHNFYALAWTFEG